MEFLHGARWNTDNIHLTARRFVAAIESGDGATAHLRPETAAASGGYVVGGLVPPVVIPRDMFDGREAFYAITGLLKAAESSHVGRDVDALGVWEDSGLVYVDASTIYPEDERDIAEFAGRMRRELAIYDRANAVCIDLTEAVATA